MARVAPTIFKEEEIMASTFLFNEGDPRLSQLERHFLRDLSVKLAARSHGYQPDEQPVREIRRLPEAEFRVDRGDL
jgi:hypothetical protein